MSRQKNGRKRQISLHHAPASAADRHLHAVVQPALTASSAGASVVPSELAKETNTERASRGPQVSESLTIAAHLNSELVYQKAGVDFLCEVVSLLLWSERRLACAGSKSEHPALISNYCRSLETPGL